LARQIRFQSGSSHKRARKRPDREEEAVRRTLQVEALAAAPAAVVPEPRLMP